MVSAALVSAAGLCYRVSQIADKEVEHFVSSSNVELPTGGMSLPPEVLPAPAKTKPVIAGEEIFTGYMANLQTRIKHFWRPSHSNVSNCTTVLFKLSPDGEMSDLRVKDSSGVDTADAAALKAVEEAAPFDHLPAGAEEIVDIQFTFNYNVSKPWLPGK
jgi:TonB family protein